MPMNNCSEALSRIDSYFGAFQTQIERCRKAPSFDAHDWMDAYSRLGNLRDRYLKEKNQGTLSDGQKKHLAKVFEDDIFTKGMMELRQVAAHVKRNKSFSIRTLENVPIELDAECSAGAVFAASTVNLPDVGGTSHRIDHLQWLSQMKERIAKAIMNAKAC